ncbi:hypothetical protein [Raineyella fluvialis]|uniref:Uncharacterized protein n=1 Tax=Raineyella fluvialis TaxID=2662261 RepID=A0A5Q2FAZ9_9ACTN|nr:hypothetical protein [Raineyella fluvialis]QGF23888.1 hypothetical protein Rai3103_09590 [Raineyella fluvialis]
MGNSPVEFVINCFERNIDLVTRPGFLTAAVGQHRFDFDTRTLLVNNVNDRDAAATLAQAAVDRGEVDRFFFVQDLFPKGLEATGLRARHFGRYLHWSDCCVAALVLPGPDLLCYVDVDLTLAQPFDWISPALEVMRSDPRVAVGNPTWKMLDGRSSARDEADEEGTGHVLGYGFSDQVFLLRRSVFTRRLLPRWLPLWVACPASCRYPAVHRGFFFEQVVDGFMRRHGLLRVTVLGASFQPIPVSTYPARTLCERVRRKRNELVLDGLAALRRTSPKLVSSPCLRVWGLLDPVRVPERIGKSAPRMSEVID